MSDAIDPWGREGSWSEGFMQWALLSLELWARTYVDRPREQPGAPIAW